MGRANYCVVSGVLFSLVALAHLLRIAFGVVVQVNDLVVPMFVSWLGFVVPAILAFWAFSLSKNPNGS